MTSSRESASHTCQCGHRYNTLADEYGDHPCPRCGWHPAVDPWDGWPPHESWTDVEHAAALIGWLERRVSTTNRVGVIIGHIRTFESMWSKQFDMRTSIPQHVKDRVNAKIRDIREAANAIN